MASIRKGSWCPEKANYTGLKPQLRAPSPVSLGYLVGHLLTQLLLCVLSYYIQYIFTSVLGFQVSFWWLPGYNAALGVLLFAMRAAYRKQMGLILSGTRVELLKNAWALNLVFSFLTTKSLKTFFF